MPVACIIPPNIKLRLACRVWLQVDLVVTDMYFGSCVPIGILSVHCRIGFRFLTDRVGRQHIANHYLISKICHWPIPNKRGWPCVSWFVSFPTTCIAPRAMMSYTESCHATELSPPVRHCTVRSIPSKCYDSAVQITERRVRAGASDQPHAPLRAALPCTATYMVPRTSGSNVSLVNRSAMLF